MATSTPLLSQSQSHSPDLETQNEENPLTLDQILEQCIGLHGWRQILQAIVVSLAWILEGQQSFISDFTDAHPSWHCITTSCSSSSDICKLSKHEWAWYGFASKTIISEWDLECASSFIMGLPATCYSVGCLLGGFVLATLADSSLGRKNLLFISCMAMSVCAFLTIFSINIWMYSILRLVSEFFRTSIGTCALVLATEMVGKTWRGPIGIMGFFFGTLGLLSLPAIAYINRESSWRILYLWTSIPGIIYTVIAYFFVSESPRWLFMQGRGDEAINLLRKITPCSQNKLILSSAMPIKQKPSKVGLYSSMKSLFMRRWVLKRILSVMILGFGTGMMYYGMLLGVGNLGFNIYLSVTFNALLIIPSYLLIYFLIDRLNRNTSVLLYSVMGGVFSIVIATLGESHKSVKIGLELVAFFCASMAFNVLMIYTVELFPTSVRNSATSMVRQAIALGVMFDPTLLSAWRGNELLSYGVFGLAIIVCAGFSVCLPESRGVTIYDTLDEQEHKDSKMGG